MTQSPASLTHVLRASGLAVIFTAAALQACAPARDPQWEKVEGRVSACLAAASADPALAAVARKLSFGPPAPAQLEDPSYPDADEAEAVSSLVRRVSLCRRIETEAVAAQRPLMVPADTAYGYQSDQVIMYLVDGAISYGQANRLLAEASQSLQARKQAYLRTGESTRRKSAEDLDDRLQRAHRAPPPLKGMTCQWQDLNLDCR